MIRNHILRGCFGIGMVLATILGAATPATAHTAKVARRAGTPFTIQTKNGNQNCVYFSPATVGTKIVQNGPPFPHQCRRMYFTREGVVTGGPYGEWLDAYGDAMASPNCGAAVSIEAHHSTGSVWINYIDPGTGHEFLASRHCDTGDCTFVLSADNVVGHDWHVLKRPTANQYQAINLVQVNSLVARHRHCCVCR